MVQKKIEKLKEVGTLDWRQCKMIKVNLEVTKRQFLYKNVCVTIMKYLLFKSKAT